MSQSGSVPKSPGFIIRGHIVASAFMTQAKLVARALGYRWGLPNTRAWLISTEATLRPLERVAREGPVAHFDL
jgi:hypothetical protein